MNPYLRLEGLVRRIVPVKNPEMNTEIIRKNLVDTYRYTGFDNPKVPLDAESYWAGQNYYHLFFALAQRYQAKEKPEEALTLLHTVESLLPRERLHLPESMTMRIDSLRSELIID